MNTNHIDIECSTLKKLEQMLKSAEMRARSKRRDFNLDLDYLCRLYVEVCPILGIDLMWENTGAVCHGSPSLDRVNNSEGYVKGNVQIISHRANGLKRDYLLAEWERMAEYMKNCNGLPLEITADCFKRPLDLTPADKRRIRAALRDGEPLYEISLDLELPIGQVSRYVTALERCEDA